VRERSGVKLVADLTGQKAELVCDPTLLLDEKEWSELAELSRIKIERPYILAYLLTYAFDPHPKIDKMMAKIQSELKMPVVYLHGRLADYKKKGSRIIKKYGPCEFVELMKHANFIVTTSLHGTAFALNFSKPFISVIENAEEDSRILSLLQLVGAQDRVRTIGDTNTEGLAMDYKPVTPELEDLRNRSTAWLEHALL